MLNGYFTVVTLILAVLKPGELIESFPYDCVLNSLKSPETSVIVREVFPFASNSTEACWIASPFGSVTLPLICIGGCWAEALNIPTINQPTTKSQL